MTTFFPLSYSVEISSISSLSQNIEDSFRRYLATTHFEPTYARAAFPCFDEPHFKARFKMSIFRDRFHIALFNMPVVTTEDVGFYMGTGLVSIRGRNSRPLKTSLLAPRRFSRIRRNEHVSSRVYHMRLYPSQ